ncbi:uncharacterized protein [Anabrus simplex]|uniref:uncharacterized protein n=1 Tax=Anabrus simplex TaxID=316456 RepID=UPI0035A27A56
MADCAGCVLNIIDFGHKYKTNLNDLLELYQRHNLLSSKRVCEKCGRDVPLRVVKRTGSEGDRAVFACRRRLGGGVRCGWFVSARKHTFFEGSNLNLFEIGYFVVLWCLLPKPLGPNVKLELGFTAKTIVDWCNFCREVCVAWVDAKKKKIGGPDIVVEIDENEFGKSRYHKGRHTEAQWVIGGVERDNHKNFFVVPMEKRDKETLLSVIKGWILPGTVIVSDFWKTYECLEDEGFVDLRENHSMQFVDTRKNGHVMPKDGTSRSTQNIKNRWRHMKSGRSSIPSAGRRKEHFVGYLSEFLFKSTFPLENRVHNFFLAVAELYPPLH